VAARFDVQGSSGIPGRHNHTVLEEAGEACAAVAAEAATGVSVTANNQASATRQMVRQIPCTYPSLLLCERAGRVRLGYAIDFISHGSTMVKRGRTGTAGRVRMQQVADAAGVSTATVSRVLSGTGYSSPAARARVTDVAARLDYRPDALARGLRRQQGSVLGILVPDLTNPTTLSFIRGVQHVAQRSGYAVAIADAQRDATTERRQLEMFQSQRVAAVIVGGLMQDPSALSIVEEGGSLVARSLADLAGHSATEQRAISEAVADLFERGHRRVLFASRAPVSDLDPPATLTEARRRAVLAAAGQHGMHVAQCRVSKYLTATETAQRLGGVLGKPGAPQALICASHGLAPQLLGGITTLGLAIPGELSFVTFGDSEWAAAYRPPLAVILLDRYQEARRLTHDLLVTLGNSPEPEGAPASPAYEPRGSVARCPETGT
jgi:DNA-binding LacI/PurR family transcriptional regulator